MRSARRRALLARLTVGLLYVLPLGVAVVLLVVVGEPLIGGALLVIEVGMVTAIRLTTRSSDRAAPPAPRTVPTLVDAPRRPGSRGLLMIGAMVGVVLALAALINLVASRGQ